MRLTYKKPILKDLSQGSRIAFVRQFRMMSQDNVSDKLGITGECKRRTMTRYERGNRNPKENRVKEISNILNINYNLIKKYDFKDYRDIVYVLMWLEELIPNYIVDVSKINDIHGKSTFLIRKGLNKWYIMRKKRIKREISYEDYIEWKLQYKIEDEYE